jgi:hypothetical protein
VFADLRLPENPEDLSKAGYVRDFSHGGKAGDSIQLWRHPSGETLEFHKKKTGFPERNKFGQKTDRGNDHYHRNGRHNKPYFPGDEIPDPPQICQQTANACYPEEETSEFSTGDPVVNGYGPVIFLLPLTGSDAFGAADSAEDPVPEGLPLRPAFGW